jgi:hypothetical protein
LIKITSDKAVKIARQLRCPQASSVSPPAWIEEIDAQVADNVVLFTNYQTQVGQSQFFVQSVQAGVKIGF